MKEKQRVPYDKNQLHVLEYAIKIQNMVRVMVFNATFNNSSAISLRSALLLEETGVPGENHRPVLVTDKFYHIYRVHLAMKGFELTTLCANLSVMRVNKIKHAIRILLFL
jgi:hypothetical protein